MYVIRGSNRKKDIERGDVREFEDIDTARNMQEALYLLGEYRLAFGSDWYLYIEPE